MYTHRTAIRVISPPQRVGHVMLRVRAGRAVVLEKRDLVRPGDQFIEVDMRSRLLTLSPQSIATAEGVDIQVTAVVSVRVTDPVRVVGLASDADAEVYLALQIALREVVAATSLDLVLVRDVPIEPLEQAARHAAREVGMEALNVRIKDVRAPRRVSEAREEAMTAQIEASTATERARAEVKATRARLAAAQMLERSPVLARIRTIEALPPGSVVKLGAQGTPGRHGDPGEDADPDATSAGD